MNELIELAKRVNDKLDSKPSKMSQEKNIGALGPSSSETSPSGRMDKKKKKKKRKLTILDQEERETLRSGEIFVDDNEMNVKRMKIIDGEESGQPNEEISELTNDYPYEVNADDHCETKVEA
jgi:hypothetical protein